MANPHTSDLQVIDRLARVEEKIDLLVGYHSKQSDDHEDRLRTLETANSKLFGVGVIASMLAGFAGPHILGKITG